jgi:phage terminase large subunit-like protein
MRKVYGDSLITRGGWVDLDRIDAEVEALLEHDAAQAERFFMNRKIAQEGAAFDIEHVKTLIKPRKLTEGSVICLGVDGARHEDSLAVVGTDVKSGYQWLVAVAERPQHAPDDYEHDLDLIDGPVTELIEGDKLVVWRAYCDDQHIRHLVDSWQNRFGEKRFVTWHTNRDKQMAWATRRYEEAISAGDVTFDGNPVFMTHLRHARKRMVTALDDKERQMHVLSKSSSRSPQKIDIAAAAVLSWEARSDALASGAVSLTETPEQPEPERPRGYEYGRAPVLTALGVGWSSSGGSDME